LAAGRGCWRAHVFRGVSVRRAYVDDHYVRLIPGDCRCQAGGIRALPDDFMAIVPECFTHLTGPLWVFVDEQNAKRILRIHDACLNTRID
jgi:hypothetical protein